MKANSEHELKLRAATRSIYDADRIYQGDFSESHKLLLRLNCDQARAFSIARSSSSASDGVDDGAGGDATAQLGTGVVAGVAVVSMAFLVVLLVLAVWR